MEYRIEAKILVGKTEYYDCKNTKSKNNSNSCKHLVRKRIQAKFLNRRSGIRDVRVPERILFSSLPF